MIDVKVTVPGRPIRNAQLGVPASNQGGEVGFVLFLIQRPLPVDGRFVLSVRSNKGFVALPVTDSS